MSTIASPRPSSSVRSPSSSRPSIELNPSSATTPTAAGSIRGGARRNRSALRDYYNIKKDDTASEASADTTLVSEEGQIISGELDQPNFDAAAYVKSTLSNMSLEEVLRVEAGLISEVRTLDGEKKALVYDNYSKLIAATDTIRKMRSNMDPLTPTTNTLSPAVSHIAETAKGLARTLEDNKPEKPDVVIEVSEEEKARERQRQTVRWVLDTPRRLRMLLEKEDGIEDAQTDWREVRALLEKWKGVDGVAQLEEECDAILDEAEKT